MSIQWAVISQRFKLPSSEEMVKDLERLAETGVTLEQAAKQLQKGLSFLHSKRSS